MISSPWFATAGVAVLAITTSASAREESAGAAAAASTGSAEPGKVHLGLRVGYAIALGEAADRDARLSDTYAGMLPIWLDVGYFVTPKIMIGLYGHYGFGMLAESNTGCPSVADCSGSVIRFGLQGQYHFSRGQSLDPWLGLGVGYELANLNVSVNGVDGHYTFRGFEFFNLQMGADVELANTVAIGPFVSFSLGQYSHLSMDPEVYAGQSDEIDEKSMHEWLTMGVKGSLGL